MERQYKLGLGAFALGVGALALAQPFGNTHQNEAVAAQAKILAQTTARLSTIEPASRSRIDYAKLDARLQRMVERPAMVGMAVGIVENGRITFLNGYG